VKQAVEQEVNKIYCENCIDTMARMPSEFIDLTVTSPPYDNLRTYNGYSFDFEKVASELFRVTKRGGVVVWVVADATIDGSETGTSFKQALYFKSIGFNIGDTMIWRKSNPFNWGSNYYYPQCFEYMFVLCKGTPTRFNLMRDRAIINAGKQFYQTRRGTDDRMEYDNKKVTLAEVGKRYNVWDIAVESQPEHPAPFPKQLASDHIISWSNAGDLVYDPFMGSGTTAAMAVRNERNFIGSEISQEYCDIANERVRRECARPRQMNLGYEQESNLARGTTAADGEGRRGMMNE